MIFRRSECKKNYKKDHKFSDGDINTFILLLRKGVDPYKYMDSWEKFDETSLLDNEAFHSSLNMENMLVIDIS